MYFGSCGQFCTYKYDTVVQEAFEALILDIILSALF